jgi:hypothetical protein
MYGTCDCGGGRGLGALGFSPVESFPAGTDFVRLSPIESGAYPTYERVDPVTFEPEPVTLTLEYPSYPTYDMSTGYDRLAWGLPLWAGLAVGAYVLANYAGGRI